ncbi:hypothetical protein [Adlercreutzia caecimuris]|uniref:hypothetical protein n=1 Tax=Adlercreutzia caecimuris TaxID=671266 RepID=UPI002587500B|nr:hypothetical protein [Adlercreutzia caecimuris]
MSEFYRFPAMARLGELTSDLQAEKVCEEAQELAEASARGSVYYEDDFEAMDVIHSAENYLRMKGHSDETLGMLQSLVIEKNRKRGYYDER